MSEPANLSLVEKMKLNNWYLMTTEEGKEMYDEDGGLLVYQTGSGNCMAVPNIDDVRKLYDLPLISTENKIRVKKEEIIKSGGLLRVQRDNKLVWVGQRSEHSMKATKMLIELFDSPKYQSQMNNPNNIKLKVWEKIAHELEEKGFKIATNSRDAGLRTFQKWRNMERTYWKFLKTNPEDCGEDKRRKKPYFFDDLHVVFSKRSKELLQESSSLCGGDNGIEKPDLFDEDDEMDIDSKPGNELKHPNGTDCDVFPRQALSLLTSLVASPKYDSCLNDPTNKLYSNRIKVWENIYMEMTKAGWKFGRTVREGAILLSEKWRMVEKNILRKRFWGQRTLFTPILRKAILMEIDKRKMQGSNYPSDPPSPEDFSHRRVKAGEIEPEAIEALLKIIDSGKIQNFFATAGGKRVKIWEKIYDEVHSQGFEIAGGTKREKVTRLFQKWRNMKRAFVKYQIAKFKGKDVKKPMFYEMMFQIISQDVLKMDCDSEEEIKMEDESDEDWESENTQDLWELSPTDHDYGQHCGTDEITMINSFELPSNVGIEQRNSSGSEDSKPLPSKPTTSRISRSHEILKQIKSLHETSLAMQQQSFSKIISLLENQVSQQTILTTVIANYVTSQANKSRSRNKHRTENNTNNGSTSSSFTSNDGNFLH